MLFYLDVETSPTADPATVAAIAAAVRPPANYKKAETVAAWERDEKPALVAERLRATALDGTYGQIFAAAWAKDDAGPQCVTGSEKEVLAAIFGAMADMPKIPAHGTRGLETDLVFVGHNVHDFDLRFMWQRAVINGIRPPTAFVGAVHAKPWAGRVADTMQIWNPSRERRISLANLCLALGVPTPKGDLDGKSVYDAFVLGEVERVRNYVLGDVVATRSCYLKMMYGREPVAA